MNIETVIETIREEETVVVPAVTVPSIIPQTLVTSDNRVRFTIRPHSCSFDSVVMNTGTERVALAMAAKSSDLREIAEALIELADILDTRTAKLEAAGNDEF